MQTRPAGHLLPLPGLPTYAALARTAFTGAIDARDPGTDRPAWHSPTPPHPTPRWPPIRPHSAQAPPHSICGALCRTHLSGSSLKDPKTPDPGAATRPAGCRSGRCHRARETAAQMGGSSQPAGRRACTCMRVSQKFSHEPHSWFAGIGTLQQPGPGRGGIAAPALSSQAVCPGQHSDSPGWFLPEGSRPAWQAGIHF